jgi:parvulin-like peptidyl-prolyl isomerase
MNVRNKKLMILGIGILAVGLAFGGVFWHIFRAQRTQAAARLDQPVLRIDRHVVGNAEFREAKNRFFKRWHRDSYMLRLTDEERNDRLVEELINQIAIEEYLKRHFKIETTEVENYLSRYVKAKYATAAELEAYLDSIGCKKENLRALIAIYLAKMRYFPQLAKESGITVTTAEIDQEFQRQKNASRKAVVQHILITNKNRTPQVAEQLAQQLYQQLLQGASFARLAGQYSDDALTSGNGGEMEPLAQETMVAQLRDKVFEAEPGQLLPVIETRQGWEIVKLRQIITYYHPRNEIADMMLMDKYAGSPQFQKWQKNIKAKMEIMILNPALKAYRCYKDQKYHEAGGLYEQVYRLDRRESYLQRALESYYLAKQWDRVIKLGKYGSRKFTDKVPYYLSTAEGFYHKNQPQKALRLLKKAEKQAGDNQTLQRMVETAYTRMKLEKTKGMRE